MKLYKINVNDFNKKRFIIYIYSLYTVMTTLNAVIDTISIKITFENVQGD